MTHAMSDPTMAFLAKFDDPQAWDRVVRNVPIFVENERWAVKPDGSKVKVKVDADRLRKIAAGIAAKEQRKGVVLRWTAGHTVLKPGPDGKAKVAPQSEQPLPLAYGRNAHFGYWGPEGAPGILCDLYIPRGRLGEVKDYPYRSAEFYPEEVTGREDSITAVAFLRTDPALDMGLIPYAGECVPLLYSLENSMDPNAPDPTLPPDMGGMIDEGKKQEFMRYMAACYPQLHQQATQPSAGIDPEKAKQILKDDQANGQPLTDKQKGMFGAAAGKEDEDEGGEDESGEDEDEKKKKGPPQMNANPDTALALHYERLAKEVSDELAQLKKERVELSTEKRRLDYSDRLRKLNEMGYQFDHADMLAYCSDFTPEMFSKHEQLLVKTCTRDVTRVPLVPVLAGAVGAPTDPDVITEQHMQAALQYQARHEGLEWEECVEKTRPGTGAAKR